MKKETLKTIILTLLIFSSVILSVQILLQSPVMPENGSLLSLLRNPLRKEAEGVDIYDTGALNSVFSPSSFVFNYDDGRLFFSTAHTEGDAIRATYNAAIKSALQSTDATEITEADWQTALQENGVHADYSVPISLSAMSAFLGNSTENTFPLTAFDQIAINFDPVTALAYVSFRNSTENRQFSVAINSAPDLLRCFEQYADTPKQSYSYAFEINLDKKVSDSPVRQNVLLNSYVLLPLESATMNYIQREPVEFDETTIDKILELFDHNPKIARRFTETNGNILFVDRASTLKLNPATGYIEYTAQDGYGIQLPGNGSLSSNATGCGKLIDDLFQLFDIDQNVTLFISTPLTDDQSTAYTVAFNYLFNGNKILTDDGDSCAVSVADGKIVAFRAFIKNYKLLSTSGETNAVSVLDYLYTTQGQDLLVINSLYTGYIDSSAPMQLCWQAEVEGSNEIITVE